MRSASLWNHWHILYPSLASCMAARRLGGILFAVWLYSEVLGSRQVLRYPSPIPFSRSILQRCQIRLGLLFCHSRAEASASEALTASHRPCVLSTP